MYSVMIAEDEYLVRLGLNVSVPWEKLDMKVVCFAEDGNMAWSSYENLLPNIVLADIRMPGIDGVELIKRIRQGKHHCEIIVITCIEDFDILYELMQMGITGYLLKATMLKDDVLELLNKAKKNLENLGINANNETSLSESNEKRNLLYDFTLNNNDSKRYLLDCNKEEYCFKYPKLGIFIGSYSPYAPPILISSIKAIFGKYLSSYGEINSFCDEEYIYIYLMNNLHEGKEELLRILKEATDYVYEILDAKVNMVIFETNNSIEKLDNAINKGKEILENSYFYPDFLTLNESKTNYFYDLRSLYDRINVLKEKIILKLNLWRSPNEKSLFNSRIEALIGSIKTNRQQFKDSLIAIAEFYYSVIGKDMTSLESLRTSISETEKVTDDLEILENRFFNKTILIHPVYGSDIVNTIEYIRKNSQQNISLAEMASMVSISPNYYAMLFKEMLNYSFSEYLGSIRIEKACDFLAFRNDSIQEISIMCGFSDVTYFSRFFKQKTGIPPHQWRVSQ